VMLYIFDDFCAILIIINLKHHLNLCFIDFQMLLKQILKIWVNDAQY